MKNYTIQYNQATAENSNKIFWLYLLQRLRLMVLTLTRIRDSLIADEEYFLQQTNNSTNYIIIFSTATHESH